MRHRPHRAAGGEVRSGTGRHRPFRADARSRPAPAAARPAPAPGACSCAATSAPCRSARAHGFGLRDGAVRRAAVADAGARPAGDARLGGPGAPPRRAVRASTSCPTCRAGPSTAGARACAARHARGTLTLVESVRQEPAPRADDLRSGVRRAARNGRRRAHRFALTFRTLSVPQMARRLEKAGFAVEAVLGDYQGGPWDERADVWVILARTEVGWGRCCR